jgi:glutamine---fructose-6-phosphate transaminase (isomerizing)
MSVTHNNLSVSALAPSPYLSDVLQQPLALSELMDDAASIIAVPRELGLAHRPRVIVSGMGSSNFGGFGLWTKLVEAGIPAWWIETAQLLDCVDGLVTADTLLWLTSQSGESGETVAVLDRLPMERVHVVGVTNNPESTLGRSAHTRIDLRAGDEATVSTKSYVNTLAVNRLVAAAVAGREDEALTSLHATVTALESYLAGIDGHVSGLSDFALDRHIVIAGRGTAAASAHVAGLVIKEAAKTPVEGMSAGALRHGPIELAGPNLAVVVFDRGPGAHRDQNHRLARDLASAGTEVGWVTNDRVDDGRQLPAPATTDIDAGIRDAVAFQTLSFELARRAGVTAGAFTFASKVTDIL